MFDKRWIYRKKRQMKLKSVPLTGKENYENLQQIWRDNDMKTFKDFLIYYNNLDVLPFISASEKMLEFYIAKGINLFKNMHFGSLCSEGTPF